jgi:uncharacterized Zn finger protein
VSKKRKPDFAPRMPLSVRGGIRVQSNRSGFARKWWSRQWLLILETFQIGARLGRGRSYAYAGQVASLELEAGRICARVQGGDASAYDCEIGCAVLTPHQQEQVLRELRKRPLLLAELLVRELPKAVDALFAAAGQPLLPGQRSDLKTSCSCPDRVNPCKHLAAVFFLLIEAFDQDPLLMLALRGISREDLIGQDADAVAVAGPDATRAAEVGPAGAPAALEATAFWGSACDDTPDFGPAPTGATAAPLVQRLGPLPLWRGEDRFMDVMTQVGSRAVSLGWQAWAGERILRSRSKLVITNPNMRLRGARMKVEG